jgi:hypothetical protein
MGCNILYLDAKEALPGWTSGAARMQLLTVSDAPGFAHHGGMIELFVEGNRLRFNINVENARRAGLRISSSLLELASRVDRVAAR